jgi:hypothetical protein
MSLIQFYRAFNFYCMVIAAEPLSPSGPPLAADWAAISIPAALETSVTASAVVASAAIAIAVTNDDNHPCDGHGVNDCLHDDGHDDLIIDNGLTSSCSPSVVCPVDRGDQHWCWSPGSMTTMTDNRTDNAEEEEHGMPSSMGMEAFTMMEGNDWSWRNFANTSHTRELAPQLCCPSSFCFGDFLRWRWSEWQRLSGWQWGKKMFVVVEVEWMAAAIWMAVGEWDFPCKLLQEEDVGPGTMGEGGEGTNKTRGGGGCKTRERRGGMAMWSPMLGIIGEELAPWGGRRQYRDCGGSYADGKGDSTDEELADCWRAMERDMRDQDNAKERGGQSPARHMGIWITGVTQGNDDAGIRNLCIFVNIMQCWDFPLFCKNACILIGLYSFQATSLQWMILADNGPGGELTRRLMVPTPLPLPVTKFQFHRPLTSRLPWPLQL